MPTKNELKYKASFFQLFIFLFLFSLIITTLSTMIDEGKIELFIFLNTLIFLILACSLVSMFFIWMFPGIINRDGIGAYTFWGKYKFINWEDVEKASSRRIAGLKYHNIFIKNQKKPLWLFYGSKNKLKEIGEELKLDDKFIKIFV